MSNKNLLEQINDLPDEKFGKKVWYEVFKRVDLEAYKEVEEIVDLFVKKDELLCRKFPSDASLGRWLVPVIKERFKDVAFGTILQLINHRRDVLNAARTKPTDK